MNYRSVASFVTLFHSLYHDVDTSTGQYQIKLWFLQALKEQEAQHYSDPVVPVAERSLLEGRTRAERLIDMIQAILNDRLVDDLDCVSYFTSNTLKTLAIIPCQTKFDRRIKRLHLSPLL
ncbi:hypothetical protein BC941DRAFT_234311 [Chlamydoabsidia padenii]|nr:hypothetical protein BC941DRAFT_234311 [Chlamydoabsidia padenii]